MADAPTLLLSWCSSATVFMLICREVKSKPSGSSSAFRRASKSSLTMEALYQVPGETTGICVPDLTESPRQTERPLIKGRLDGGIESRRTIAAMALEAESERRAVSSKLLVGPSGVVGTSTGTLAAVAAGVGVRAPSHREG